jgi:hypothetical protein
MLAWGVWIACMTALCKLYKSFYAMIPLITKRRHRLTLPTCIHNPPRAVMPERFPEVEGGGSLILAWQIKNKRVLVVGGGEVSPSSILQNNSKS